MRGGTSRDKRRQSRLVRGNKDGFEILTVNHAADGAVRLDATITYTDDSHEVGVYAHEHEDLLHENFMKVYSPTEGDEAYVGPNEDDDLTIDCTKGQPASMDTVAWWRMSCGKVLGIYDGRLIEYDPSTLAPLGLVVAADELMGSRVMVVGSGIAGCNVENAEAPGMEGADCADYEGEEQALLLINTESGQVTAVQPNEDGSYWRKIVRNKMIRMKEKRREQAAAAIALEFDMPELKVVSSYGPYTSTVGTAKTTGVKSLEDMGKKAEKVAV